jgi:hypothetical protein
MDMPGTALSLSSLVFGALNGQVVGLVHKWLDYKYKLKHLKADTYLKDKNNARNSGSARFQVTRRIITIMVISTFCFIHIVPAWTGIPVYVFYTESNGLFSSIFYGDSSIHVQDLRGFVITSALTYLVGMLAGLYYGINNVGK